MHFSNQDSENAAIQLLTEKVQECATITSKEFKEELRALHSGANRGSLRFYQAEVSSFLQASFKEDKMPGYIVNYNGIYNEYVWAEEPVEDECDEECDDCWCDDCEFPCDDCECEEKESSESSDKPSDDKPSDDKPSDDKSSQTFVQGLLKKIFG